MIVGCTVSEQGFLPAVLIIGFQNNKSRYTGYVQFSQLVTKLEWQLRRLTLQRGIEMAFLEVRVKGVFNYIIKKKSRIDKQETKGSCPNKKNQNSLPSSVCEPVLRP